MGGWAADLALVALEDSNASPWRKATLTYPGGAHPPTPFEETLTKAASGSCPFWHVLVFLDPYSHEISCIFLHCTEKVSFRY